MDKHFSNLEIMNLIKACESKYPVDTWVIDNIHIWPLIRNNLPHLVISNSHSSCKKSTDKSGIKTNSIWFVAYNFFSGIYLIIKLLINSFFFKSCYTLLVSDGVSYTKINDIWVERFCDPITKSLKKNSNNYLLLEQTKNNKNNTLNQYISVSCIEIISYYIARLWSIFNCGDIKLSGYDNFLSNKKIQKFKKKLSQKELALVVKKIKICSFFFSMIIKVYGIKQIFIVCYYGIIGYSLSLSSRKYNTTVIDIEHGSIFNCPAYCEWSKIPKYGYELLPHKFELWHYSLKDAFINSNHSDFIKFHRPKVSGLRILEYIKKTQISKNKSIKNFKKKHSYLILVTLQPQFFGFNDWDKLSEVIKRSPKDWGWIIRYHPAYNDLSGMEKILSISQYNVLQDNGILNLYEVLESSQCHVTTASAACLEAMMMGVPTVLISKTGYEDFLQLIEKGYACYAENIDQINHKIKSILEY